MATSSAAADFAASYCKYSIALLGGATAASWSYWLYFDVTTTQSYLSVWSGNFSWLQKLQTSKIRMLVSADTSGGANFNNFQGDTALTTGQWYHATSVWSGQANWKLYLDGVDTSLTQIVDNGTVNSLGTPSVDYTIGATGGGGEQLNGKMAHIHVYDRAITFAESESLRFKPMSVAGNLVSYIPCNFTSTDICRDQVRGDSGTITGAGLTEYIDGPPISFKGGQ